MTLNSFYLEEVTFLDVLRLKEFINIGKKINTSSIIIFLREKNEGYNDGILKIRGKFEIITENIDISEGYMLIKKEEIENMRDNISPWYYYT